MTTNANIVQETVLKPGLCEGLHNVPNAWGHQRYSGEYLRISVDNQKDVNNNFSSYGTLRNFVIRHIEGIRMKNKMKVDYCNHCTCQD